MVAVGALVTYLYHKIVVSCPDWTDKEWDGMQAMCEAQQ